jgi:hypothetical protein
MRTVRRTIAVGFLAGTLFCAAYAGPSRAPDKGAPQSAAGNSRIGIQGIVVEGGTGSFGLLSGQTEINVQMHGWKWYGDYAALDGDRATVFGPITAALFKSHTLRPDAVYVADLKTYFQNGSASTAAGQPSLASYIFHNEPLGDYVSLSGRVSSVAGGKLQIAVPGGPLNVDTTELAGGGELAGSPVGNIERNDRVAVFGSVDDEFWSKLSIRADDIVKLAMATPDNTPR